MSGSESIFDSIDEIVYVTDPNTYEILYVNKALRDTFRKELLGGICYQEFQGLGAPCDFCTNQVILKERYKPYYWEYHNPPLNRDYAIVDRIIRWPDGRDVRFELAVDITARKRMEQEVIRMERQQALGEMATGVAHNLNNILTTVLGPAQILKRKTDAPELLKEIDTILISAYHARDVVQRLSQSVQGKEEKPLYAVLVSEVVREVVQETRRRWQAEGRDREGTIEIVTQLKESVPIRGTRSGLHKVLLNMLTNAGDAMPEGGMITLCSGSDEAGVQLNVSDTGVGMEDEIRRRVFEPFFTTKQTVDARLGLSTAYGIVTGWGGDIKVESAPGKGTAFTLYLPVWTGAVKKEEGEEKIEKKRRGRILIVEDEELVCSMLFRYLSKKHDVEAVANGQEALECFAAQRYDVVLIDLVMPGIPGDQVVQEMRRIDPSICTVLVTGWPLAEDDPRKPVFDFHLQKPIGDLRQIERVVLQALALHQVRVEEKPR